jgi:Tfp pilus assembly protein PilX
MGAIRRSLDPRAEEGIALVLSLAVLVFFSITTVAAVTMANSTTRSAASGGAQQNAYAMAEAGINSAQAILNSASNNPSSPTLLGCSTSGVNAANSATPCTDLTTTTSFGTASFHGLYTQGATSGTWVITSTGSVPYQNGAGSLNRVTTATTTITGGGQAGNISVWNYLYSTAPQGAGCEFNLSADNSEIDVPLYITGDVCLSGQSARIVQNTANGGQPVDVRIGGTLSILGGSAYAGTSASPLNSGYVAGGCITVANPTAHPCTTTDRYYVTTADTPIVAVPPVTDFPSWYLNASPGPKHICDTTLTPAPNLTGATNKFDNDVTMNGTNPAFNLTPTGSDYNCVTASGSLSWNHSTHILTISGTIFFDGNVTMQDGSAMYHGRATIYVNGEVFFNNGSGGSQASLRAGCPASPAAPTAPCGFNVAGGWNPNKDLIIFVSNKTSGTSVDMTSDGTLFQGNILCPPTGTLLASGDTATVEGGVICGKFSLTQDHYHFYPLPSITTLPPGAPVPPNSPATISAPTYSG